MSKVTSIQPDPVCPLCEAEGAVEVVMNDIWAFPQGPSTPAFQADGITCFHCSACDEKYVNSLMDKLNQPKIIEARRKAQKLLTSDEITELLVDLGLSEKELEQVLGLGPHSFTRWKKAQVCQSPSTDALLVALKRFPELIAVLAERRGLKLTGRKKGRPRKAGP